MPDLKTVTFDAETLKKACFLAKNFLVTRDCDDLVAKAHIEGLIKVISALMDVSAPTPAVTHFDVEKMLKETIPGGDLCDPQKVCDAIREWVSENAPTPAAQCEEPHGFMDCVFEGEPPEGYANWRDWGAVRLHRGVTIRASNRPDRTVAQSAGQEVARYFVYDNEYGYNEFKTDAERDAAHKSAIAGYLDDGWSEEVDSVVSGIVTHKTVKCNVEPRPESCAEHPGHDGENCDACEAWNEYPNHEFDYCCSYEPEALAAAPVNGINQDLIDMLVEVLDKVPLTDSTRMVTPTATKARAVIAKARALMQAAPVNGGERELREKVAKALGLVTGGIRDGKPIGFAWSYLLGQIEQLVLLAERYAEESRYPALERAHFGDPDKRTGIYATRATKPVNDSEAVAPSVMGAFRMLTAACNRLWAEAEEVETADGHSQVALQQYWDALSDALGVAQAAISAAPVNGGERPFTPDWAGYRQGLADGEAERAADAPQVDELREAARQFHNLTQGDPEVIIRPPSAEKRDAIVAAGARLRAALSSPAKEQK